MKFHTFLFTIIVLMLSACSSVSESERPGDADINREKDVIESHGSIENIDLLTRFTEHVQEGEKDSIKVIQYTTEGDPIISQLEYNQKLNYTLDTTHDSFGSGEVYEHECDSMKMEETATETTYYLTGCSGEGDRELLTVSYNTEQQDYFAVSLESPHYEMNTKQMQWIEKSEGTEKVTSDFQLSTEHLNKIYKQLVFANYLEEKTLSSACDTNNNQTYKLEVWINNGKREFEWAACDDGEDSKEMIAVAERIIAIGKLAGQPE
ncbi:DUF4362 domain-containing protein [Jeotgalibacillus sp. ET6]|uniref:DUF4362 domain-containing protein n=1 Tax=Jeotgalibacillus sp. ET6 TaxID=3037260 RepID=UPI00241865A2|nr:DUF4362 domain-containing protein [Jeotgalibacillus sp. ET6]MDG5472000.1 DUF4362 domain-containing protein [Jeotgalibacillus sp. ET6]